ncbi:hypothetical protein SLEP1_g16124 [Rubroshorea leprosula]|uniref:Uncharacterized protein n=1 Tax=Rubroshorea leprosula TaxID=152421 RepID=A0AAV5IXI0_9ROSI|nr:hypothetical protein SLEP1_g16124 [Rubroshorea leprosula]
MPRSPESSSSLCLLHAPFAHPNLAQILCTNHLPAPPTADACLLHLRPSLAPTPLLPPLRRAQILCANQRPLVPAPLAPTPGLAFCTSLALHQIPLLCTRSPALCYACAPAAPLLALLHPSLHSVAPPALCAQSHAPASCTLQPYRKKQHMPDKLTEQILFYLILGIYIGKKSDQKGVSGWILGLFFLGVFLFGFSLSILGFDIWKSSSGGSEIQKEGFGFEKRRLREEERRTSGGVTGWGFQKSSIFLGFIFVGIFLQQRSFLGGSEGNDLGLISWVGFPRSDSDLLPRKLHHACFV